MSAPPAERVGREVPCSATCRTEAGELGSLRDD